MTWQIFGKITHEDRIKVCKHLKAVEDQHWRKDGFIMEETGNIIVNIEIESSDKESEDSVSTCCPESGSAMETV
jgi:hypothetical protein